MRGNYNESACVLITCCRRWILNATDENIFSIISTSPKNIAADGNGLMSLNIDKIDKFTGFSINKSLESAPEAGAPPPAFGTLPSIRVLKRAPHRQMREISGRCAGSYPKNSSAAPKKSSRSVFTLPRTFSSATGLISRPCSAAMTPQVPSCASSLARTPRRVASTRS